MTLRTILFAFLLSMFTSAIQAQKPKVEIKTELGSIIAKLFPGKAPITCENFIRYIEDNKYDTASFYRVVRMDNQPDNEIKIEVIQGGLGFDRLDSGYPPIKHETTKETGMKHKNSVLSMARSEPGSASSEFFICIGDQPELDFGGQRNPDGEGFAAFGKIIKGMDVVREIQSKKDNAQMLIAPVVIHSISVLK